MKIFKAIIISSGEFYEYESESPCDMDGLNPKEDHIDLGAITVTMPFSKITKLSFLNRFTNQELGTFYTYVASDIGMQILEKKLMAAMYIDLKDANTIYAMNVLRAVGIIASDTRLDEILNTVPLESELYDG